MNSKQIALLIAFITLSSVMYVSKEASKPSQFELWKAKHVISFSSEFQNAYRQKIFLQNLAKVKAHNANKENTYEMGLNQFSALTQEEFAETYLTLQVPSDFQINEVEEDYQLLGDVDWNTHGAVTPVKNQGQCGSCWAFSTTGAFQGLYKLVHGELLSFSESQLIDCSNGYGNQGCKGGLQANAFEYIQENGITTEDQYPYVPIQNSCKDRKGPYTFSNYIVLSTCTYLSNTISARPVAVSVDATNWSSYKSGVFNNCKTSINHGVTLTGVKGGNWVIKNSWGTEWGDNGYITLASGNTCAICSMGSYPLR